MAIKALPDLYCTLYLSLLLLNLTSSSHSPAANDLQFTKHGKLSLASVPLHTFSLRPLFKWPTPTQSSKLNQSMAMSKETSSSVSPHILFLPFPFFLWAHKVFQACLTAMILSVTHLQHWVLQCKHLLGPYSSHPCTWGGGSIQKDDFYHVAECVMTASLLFHGNAKQSLVWVLT